MRRYDAQKQEDGFEYLRVHATEHFDELVTEFRYESDPGLRCWLLELIGHARSPKALPLYVEQLHGSDEALRSWAVAGLPDVYLFDHEALDQRGELVVRHKLP